MKKLLATLLTSTMVLTLAACGGAPAASSSAPAASGAAPASSAAPAESTAGGDTAELALITDVGTIDDKSFNQGAWEGLKQYAEENGTTHKYYKPTEKSTDAYLSAIELAVKGGAKVIVTPGFMFEEPITIAQEQHPDVMFVFIDGTPSFVPAANSVNIMYAEEQAGFLAGYAAVKDGYTKLGFMGGMAVPAVVRYGYGFIQGADAAASEMGVTGITMNYHYTGGFDATPEAQTLAASWYQGGTEVIFGCGGQVGNSVMAAAEASNAKVIGVDVDQSPESATVITSAMKGLSVSVYDTIKAFYAGSFPGNQALVLNASNNGVQLPMGTSKFTTFAQADYDAVFGKLVSDEGGLASGLMKDEEGKTAADVPVKNVTVTIVE